MPFLRAAATTTTSFRPAAARTTTSFPPRQGIYERPESLVVPKGPASLQRRDGKDHALDTSPFEGAVYVEGPDEVEGSSYVFAEARRAPPVWRIRSMSNTRRTRWRCVVKACLSTW